MGNEILYSIAPDYTVQVQDDGRLHYSELSLHYFEEEVAEGVHGPQRLRRISDQHHMVDGEFAQGWLKTPSAKSEGASWRLCLNFEALEFTSQGLGIVRSEALLYDAGRVEIESRQERLQGGALIDHIGHYLAGYASVDLINAITSGEMIPEVGSPLENEERFVKRVADQLTEKGFPTSRSAAAKEGDLSMEYDVIFPKGGLAERVLSFCWKESKAGALAGRGH